MGRLRDLAVKLKRSAGITIVEIVIYGGFIGLIGFGIYEGILFFQEWQCRKNIASVNEAIDLFQAQPGSTLKSLDDIKPHLKSSKTLPKCPTVPTKFNYLFIPEEKRVRCAYHGVL